MRDLVRRFVAANRRPASAEYLANHARFKFVLTSRTTMTVEVETLKELNLPIEQYTELRGMQLNADAVRQHGLEQKLIQALESMNVPKKVLEECFIPQVNLKDTFYDLLPEIVRNTLKKGENLEDKMLAVLEVLNPAQQIRNTEAIGLDAKQCFDLFIAPRLTQAKISQAKSRPVKSVHYVKVDSRILRLSNLDKVLYHDGDFKKRDMLRYYKDIAPAVLPHLRGRPFTFRRFPSGVTVRFF